MNILSQTQNFLGLESVNDFLIVVCLSVVNAVILTILATRFLQVLQLSGYKLGGVVNWLKETKFSSYTRLLLLSLLSGAALLITNVLLKQFMVVRILCYIGIVFYLVFCGYSIFNIFSQPQKTPLRYTKRIRRLIGVLLVLNVVASFGLLYVSNRYIPYFVGGGMAISPMLEPILVVLAHLITKPLEKCIANSYIKKAKAKLSKFSNLKVIGITGSFGKTSVKNIIAGLLSQKYKVCASPLSYNTPLGLSKTILENLKDDDEILIAEMGTKHVGDIAYLCDIARPSIGVITGIGNQHMASFGSKKKLVLAKGELAKYITNCGGQMVINTQTDDAAQMYKECKCKKYWHAEVATVEDVVCTSRGSTFTLKIDGKQYPNVTTTLLGQHNISNILVGVTVARILGLSAEEIIAGIENLAPTTHRLALVPSKGGLIIIDDAYNGSVEGAKAAIDVLKNFDGQKVIITPGLVELGKEQFVSNFELGKLCATVCDYCIIDSAVNKEALFAGLEFGKFDTSKILFADNLSSAVNLLNGITKPGDVVLFENDLPDNYK